MRSPHLRAVCLAVTVFLATVICGRAASPAFSPDEGDVAYVRDTPTHLWLIQFGYRRHQLAYAVFTARRKPVKEFVGLVDAEPDLSGGRRFFVSQPDGGHVPVPGPIQLFEQVDGRFRTVRQRVTVDQFNAFVGGEGRPDYSLRSLLRYVRRYRRDSTGSPLVRQHPAGPYLLTRRPSERFLAARSFFRSQSPSPPESVAQLASVRHREDIYSFTRAACRVDHRLGGRLHRFAAVAGCPRQAAARPL